MMSHTGCSKSGRIQSYYWLTDSIKDVDINSIYEIETRDPSSIEGQAETIEIEKELLIYECKEILTSKSWILKVLNKKGRTRKRQSSIGPYLRLSHPHLERLKEVFETKFNIYFIVEAITGGRMIDRIESCFSVYTDRDVARIIRQIIEAIEYLHRNDIIHSSLKFRNVMYEDTGVKEHALTMKLADYFFANIHRKKIIAKTSSNLFICAPEELRGSLITKAVDMWSVGILVYIMLSGLEPFSSSTPAEMFKKILKCDYSVNGAELGDLSIAAKDFIQKLIVLNPEKRMTAHEALRHIWITEASSKTILLEGTLDRLLNFKIRKKFEVNMLAVRASQLKPLRHLKVGKDIYRYDVIAEENVDNLEEIGVAKPVASIIRDVYPGYNNLYQHPRQLAIARRGYGLPEETSYVCDFDDSFDEYSPWFENELTTAPAKTTMLKQLPSVDSAVTDLRASTHYPSSMGSEFQFMAMSSGSKLFDEKERAGRKTLKRISSMPAMRDRQKSLTESEYVVDENNLAEHTRKKSDAGSVVSTTHRSIANRLSGRFFNVYKPGGGETTESPPPGAAAASHEQLFTGHAGVSYGRDVKQYLEEARLNLRNFIRNSRESRASGRLPSFRISNVGTTDKDSLIDLHVFPDVKKDEELPQMKTYYNEDWQTGDHEEGTEEVDARTRQIS